MSNWLNSLLTLFLEATNPVCTDLIWLLWTDYFNSYELSLIAMYWLSQLLCTNCFNSVSWVRLLYTNRFSFYELSQTAMYWLFQLLWAESDCYVLTVSTLWAESDCCIPTVSASMSRVRLLCTDCFNFYELSWTAMYWLFQLLWPKSDCYVLTVSTSVT